VNAVIALLNGTFISRKVYFLFESAAPIDVDINDHKQLPAAASPFLGGTAERKKGRKGIRRMRR
jgi:hypothetical protein